jgi:hypothetical protein
MVSPGNAAGYNAGKETAMIDRKLAKVATGR